MHRPINVPLIGHITTLQPLGPAVPVGDDGLYMEATVKLRVALGPTRRDGPYATVTIVVDQERRAGVHSVMVEPRDGDPPLTDQDLRALSLDQCVQSALSSFARFEPKFPHPRFVDPEDPPRRPTQAEVDSAAYRSRRRRTAPTPERLRAVALAYKQGSDSGGSHPAGVAAVRDDLHVGRSQAYRLVDQAKAAGYIETPTDNREE